jgi:hypothetical protein
MKYRVTIEETTQTVDDYQVEADDEEEARDIAAEKAQEGEEPDWHQGQWCNHYVTEVKEWKEEDDQ